METLDQIEALDTKSSCSSSSVDSSEHFDPVKPAASSSSACLSIVCRNSNKPDLRTDFRLGLIRISPPFSQPELASYSTPREPSLFVKVYMEGIPVGRKLNLLEHHSYDGLVEALGHMFRTFILFPYSQPLGYYGNFHVLTYEDQEGDWMMAGDVPWEMFLASVKRLKITRADKC